MVLESMTLAMGSFFQMKLRICIDFLGPQGYIGMYAALSSGVDLGLIPLHLHSTPWTQRRLSPVPESHSARTMFPALFLLISLASPHNNVTMTSLDPTSSRRATAVKIEQCRILPPGLPSYFAGAGRVSNWPVHGSLALISLSLSRLYKTFAKFPVLSMLRSIIAQEIDQIFFSYIDGRY
ncbi:hypothetical protein BJX66DRAFT_256222 [Aspergillus keveii]|uniref:Uncharacterized protein n=1 Tax=Aspergillus keveii TaxID=714993 RepID=A0ABR4FYX1_9EURO